MCGIVGAVAERNVVEILLEGLKRLEYRGYDSAGVALLQDDGSLKRIRRTGKVQELADAVAQEEALGGTGIAHTRWATHGGVTEQNAHPHVSNNEIAVVHNGIIENHSEQCEKLKKLGYKFESETDTEVIAHLIHYFYKKEKNTIDKVEKEFGIEKELLLALMGIETNFGTYVGKMDILSSLATLSFDKRRSEFFTNELLILLRLIENEQIDYKTLYGSWAGAFGFFQFMPSTMKNYAIDHDGNGYIDLKNNNDAYASASNYLNQIGWKSENPCFYRIDLSDNIPSKYLNISAKKLHDKKKLKYFRKFIKNNDQIDNKYNSLKVAIITPDKDIIPDAETLNPAYIVFDNYEIILKWNRSLRFALAVCTLKDKFKNEL